MKNVSGLILGTFLLGNLAFADLKIPSSVYQMEELDKAKAEAAEKKEPLIFVVTNPGTT